MRLISRGFLCILLVALLGMTLTASAQRLPDAPATQTVTYAASDENFPNPERGFYDQDAPLWLKTERNPQSVETLRALREDGISLVRWYLLIDEFRGKPISQNALNYIDRQFDAVREAGIKVIPRFAYNFPMGEAIIAIWPRQARYLADGDDAGLEAYQAGLPRGQS